MIAWHRIGTDTVRPRAGDLHRERVPTLTTKAQLEQRDAYRLGRSCFSRLQRAMDKRARSPTSQWRPAYFIPNEFG